METRRSIVMGSGVALLFAWIVYSVSEISSLRAGVIPLQQRESDLVVKMEMDTRTRGQVQEHLSRNNCSIRSPSGLNGRREGIWIARGGRMRNRFGKRKVLDTRGSDSRVR